MFACDRLKELLRAKLTECGWKDQMKAHCKGTAHRLSENPDLLFLDFEVEFCFLKIWINTIIFKTIGYML